MKKAHDKAYSAFINRVNFKRGNYKVEVVDGEVYYYLFGNLIATINKKGETLINHCNYITRTTQKALSNFVRINMVKGVFIINQRFKWENGWLDVNKIY